jgi:hypothetical protein
MAPSQPLAVVGAAEVGAELLLMWDFSNEVTVATNSP